MPKVTYVEHNGVAHTVDVPVGTSVIRGAVDNNIPGIFAAVAQTGSRLSCQIRMTEERNRLLVRKPEGQH